LNAFQADLRSSSENAFSDEEAMVASSFSLDNGCSSFFSALILTSFIDFGMVRVFFFSDAIGAVGL